jgi:hypothetical protein
MRSPEVGGDRRRTPSADRPVPSWCPSGSCLGMQADWPRHRSSPEKPRQPLARPSSSPSLATIQAASTALFFLCPGRESEVRLDLAANLEHGPFSRLFQEISMAEIGRLPRGLGTRIGREHRDPAWTRTSRGVPESFRRPNGRPTVFPPSDRSSKRFTPRTGHGPSGRPGRRSRSHRPGRRTGRSGTSRPPDEGPETAKHTGNCAHAAAALWPGQGARRVETRSVSGPFQRDLDADAATVTAPLDGSSGWLRSHRVRPRPLRAVIAEYGLEALPFGGALRSRRRVS